MNASIEEMRNEAVGRLDFLKIQPGTIRKFEKKGTVCISDPADAIFIKLEKTMRKQLAELEKENNILFYAAVREHDREIGTIDSFLYVSNDRDKWEKERKDLVLKRSYAYVINHDDPYDCGFGYIGIGRTEHAGLLRRW